MPQPATRRPQRDKPLREMQVPSGSTNERRSSHGPAAGAHRGTLPGKSPADRREKGVLSSSILGLGPSDAHREEEGVGRAAQDPEAGTLEQDQEARGAGTSSRNGGRSSIRSGATGRVSPSANRCGDAGSPAWRRTARGRGSPDAARWMDCACVSARRETLGRRAR